MSNPKIRATGLTRAKLVLIGVLAMVLATVIIVQLPAPPTSSQVTATAAPKRRTTSSRNNPQNVHAKLAEPVELSELAWPEHSLQTVLAHDPFAQPDWIHESGELSDSSDRAGTDEIRETAAANQLLADLKSKGLSMVMITGDERLAKVGQTKLRVGDRVGKFVVHEISTNGVVLIEHRAP